MYFKNRLEAGLMLAEQIVPKYRYENCAVVALSDGGTVVAAEIASKLHCVLTMLLMEPIKLPGEPDPVAVIDQEGGFTYNSMFTPGELEEFNSEFYQYIEAEKLTQLHKITSLLGQNGTLERHQLKGYNVILVSDGFNNGLSLEASVQYLKPVNTEKIIVATPVASIKAVDRMHLLADELYCLYVPENFMEINHYYEDNTLPPHEGILTTLQNIVLAWQ